MGFKLSLCIKYIYKILVSIHFESSCNCIILPELSFSCCFMIYLVIIVTHHHILSCIFFIATFCFYLQEGGRFNGTGAEHGDD